MGTHREFLIDVRLGKVVKHSIEQTFGKNLAVPLGDWEIVSTLSAPELFLTTPTTVRVKGGGSVKDTFSGDGAQEVVVEGLDTDGDLATDIISTAGIASSQATTVNFIRTHRAFVATAGDYVEPTNAANMVIERTDGTLDLLVILLEEGQTQHAVYTIPRNKTGFILNVEFSARSVMGADFRVMQRRNILQVVGKLGAKRIVRNFDSIIGDFSYTPRAPFAPLPELTDIWVKAFGHSPNTAVSATFELLLVDN